MFGVALVARKESPEREWRGEGLGKGVEQVTSITKGCVCQDGKHKFLYVYVHTHVVLLLFAKTSKLILQTF